MAPLYRPPLHARKTLDDLAHEAECSQIHLLTSRLHRYTFPTQEVISLIHRLYGLHAALLTTDALERERPGDAKKQAEASPNSP